MKPGVYQQDSTHRIAMIPDYLQALVRGRRQDAICGPISLHPRILYAPPACNMMWSNLNILSFKIVEDPDKGISDPIRQHGVAVRRCYDVGQF